MEGYMPKVATNLAAFIRDKTLELLLEKEPEEITTRDIAKACGVTATSLYYYYNDRESLFTEVKLCCIEKMDKVIAERIVKLSGKGSRTGGRPNPLGEARVGFEAFRDWAFDNPRIALLIMERLKPDTCDDPEKMKKYYRSTMFAKETIDKLVKTGVSDSKDTLLDACLCIAALWGAIEFVLLNRTHPQFWTRRGGLHFTDNMIDLLLTSLVRKKPVRKRPVNKNDTGNETKEKI